MSVKKFCGLLNEAEVGKHDKKWFPRWLRRYAAMVNTVDGILSVSQTDVIAFSRSLLDNGTPARQRSPVGRSCPRR